METNNNYDYLFLDDMTKNTNNTLNYKLDNKVKCISTKSQKWFIDMELLEFHIGHKDLSFTVDNSYLKIYVLINELKTHDDLKYHFICKKESVINGYILKPLNKFNFNNKSTCLTIPKLTFSFYKYCNKLNKLDKLSIENTNSLPLELIIKYENS